jgi:hypothetical protein
MILVTVVFSKICAPWLSTASARPRASRAG